MRQDHPDVPGHLGEGSSVQGTPAPVTREPNAEYLASLFPDSLIVKGFNVISAWALQLGPKDASRQVCIFAFYSYLAGILYLNR